MRYYISAITKKYATFSGRARRTEFWMFVLFNFLAQFVLLLGTSVLLGILAAVRHGPGERNAAEIVARGEIATSGAGVMLLPLLLLLLYWLAIIIPGLAVTVRRLHDTDKSGWWYFIGLVPLVGPILLFVSLVTDGTPGSNRYGPDPKRG